MPLRAIFIRQALPTLAEAAYVFRARWATHLPLRAPARDGAALAPLALSVVCWRITWAVAIYALRAQPLPQAAVNLRAFPAVGKDAAALCAARAVTAWAVTLAGLVAHHFTFAAQYAALDGPLAMFFLWRANQASRRFR